MSSLKLKVRNIYVHTNLEVRLKSRTTKEEANKEVERMIDKKKYSKVISGKLKDVSTGESTPLTINYQTTSLNSSNRMKPMKIYSGMGSPLTMI